MPDFYDTCSFICVCLIPLATITYEVFGIVYLVDNYKNLDIPCIKYLWAYVLASLILGLTHVGATKYKDTLEKNFCDLICIGLLNTGFAIWGGIELMNPTCQMMYDNPFWKFGFITFILQAVTSVFIMLMSCCLSFTIPSETQFDDRYLYNQI